MTVEMLPKRGAERLIRTPSFVERNSVAQLRDTRVRRSHTRHICGRVPFGLSEDDERGGVATSFCRRIASTDEPSKRITSITRALENLVAQVNERRRGAGIQLHPDRQEPRIMSSEWHINLGERHVVMAAVLRCLDLYSFAAEEEIGRIALGTTPP